MKTIHVRANKAEWQHETWVDSDTARDVEYEIVRRRGGNQLRCACLGYTFSKARPKTCKHIDAYHAPQTRVAAVAVAVRVQPEPKRSVTVKGETFTFRRAFAFGEIPTGGDR